MKAKNVKRGVAVFIKSSPHYGPCVIVSHEPEFNQMWQTDTVFVWCNRERRQIAISNLRRFK